MMVRIALEFLSIMNKSKLGRRLASAVVGGLALLLSTTASMGTEITHISRDGNNTHLEWETAAERTIVQTTPSLNKPFQYTGNVLSSNNTSLTNSENSTFYRLREVEVINFEDENLKNAVIGSIPHKFSPTTEVYDMEVENTTSIRQSAFNNPTNAIGDLSGLERFTGITYLWLEYNRILSIPQIAQLKELYSLNLNGNQISDLNPLSGLIHLRSLYLSKNQITNIYPLVGMTDLDSLIINGNQISDITPLAGLTNLISLYLNNNKLTNITPLEGLTNLKYLWLHDNNQLTNVTSLVKIPNLRQLTLSNNHISDISALRGLTNLNYLVLDNNQISDLSPLVENITRGGFRNLPERGQIYLRGNPLSDKDKNEIIPLIRLLNIDVFY
jgi:Leucine-rich repeat (LRR) protein